MSETVDEATHTHILVDLDDMFVFLIKTKEVDIEWVEVIEDLKNKNDS